MSSKQGNKAVYFERVKALFQEYKRVMVVNVDNISSSLMQKNRQALRGKAVILMGKNTLIRRCIKEITNIPGIVYLSNALKLNVGLIFTNEDLHSIRELVALNKISGPAKAGAIAPCDVIVPAGNTGLEPGQTTFLQALNINTKIARGTIEILNDVKVITKGDKVGSSEAALLQKLKITPFFFELQPLSVFEDGQIYPIEMLDIKDSDLEVSFAEGNKQLTALCLATKTPCPGALPYYLKGGFKNCLAIAEASGYTFDLHKKFAERSSSAAAVAAPAAESAAPAKGESKKEEKKVEEEEESEDADIGGLFD
ncbi:putative 60S acidic ribosomal protein P0 [Blattamonas nauphoetae]|uniref:60S acidic ribosomal protein P0 n=1 Tax=Blattamonas nauphoetae TaxID=2049346 RepID=A0ABQ9WRP3_9EUKA|nr:putative 60S acidic ribosomal protein P0 [Blattamonas nauphoetae]